MHSSKKQLQKTTTVTIVSSPHLVFFYSHRVPLNVQTPKSGSEVLRIYDSFYWSSGSGNQCYYSRFCIGTVTRYYCDWHSYPLLLWLGRSYFYALGEVKYTYPKLHLRIPIQLLLLEPQHLKYSPHFWSTLVIGTIVWSFGIYNSEAHSVYQPAGSVTRLV